MNITHFWRPKRFQVGVAILFDSWNKRINIAYGPGILEISFWKVTFEDEEDE